MATTKIWPIRQGSSIKLVIDYVENPDKTTEQVYRLETEQMRIYTKSEFENMTDVMEYAMNDYKTEERRLVSGINVSTENAREEMMITKRHYHKEDKIILWHGYQSFKPGEVTSEEAHMIGKELAENLWGKDYEVIVCTHIDRSHIHNHFVINSVSFKTGKKLDAKWQDMMRESDRLCEKYAKSVIKNPQFKGKHYKMYMDEKHGKHTWISLIKDDIDGLVEMSVSMGDFLRKLIDNGYEYKADRKYFTIRPPGKERFVKLERWLGEEYSLTGIEMQIEKNVKNGSVHILQEKKYHCRNIVPKPNASISGYRGLYLYYCYQLGIFPKRNSKRTHYLLREELLNLDKISEDTRFLVKTKIADASELEYYRQNAEIEAESLKKQRTLLRNELRHADEDKAQGIRQRIHSLNSKIKDVQKEIDICNDIMERSTGLKKKAEFVRNTNEKIKLHDIDNTRTI